MWFSAIPNWNVSLPPTVLCRTPSCAMVLLGGGVVDVFFSSSSPSSECLPVPTRVKPSARPTEGPTFASAIVLRDVRWEIISEAASTDARYPTRNVSLPSLNTHQPSTSVSLMNQLSDTPLVRATRGSYEGLMSNSLVRPGRTDT